MGDTVGFTGTACKVLFVNKWVSWSIINTWLIGPALWQNNFLSHFSTAECISGTILPTDILAEDSLAEGRMFPFILCRSACKCVVDNMRDYVMVLHVTSVFVMIRSVPPLITTKTSLTEFCDIANIIEISSDIKKKKNTTTTTNKNNNKKKANKTPIQPRQPFHIPNFK